MVSHTPWCDRPSEDHIGCALLVGTVMLAYHRVEVRLLRLEGYPPVTRLHILGGVEPIVLDLDPAREVELETLLIASRTMST